MEKIFQILKAGMQAPSACNQQPWEFYVVKDKAVIGRLSEASPYAKCARDAPVVFVPCFRSKGIAPEYFNIDMSAAVENLLLEADELGLGAVWMGISPDEGRMKLDEYLEKYSESKIESFCKGKKRISLRSRMRYSFL